MDTYLDRHIPLLRIWQFGSGQMKLDLSDHSHMVDCAKCLAAFRISIRAKTFEDARHSVSGSNSP